MMKQTYAALARRIKEMCRKSSGGIKKKVESRYTLVCVLLLLSEWEKGGCEDLLKFQVWMGNSHKSRWRCYHDQNSAAESSNFTLPPRRRAIPPQQSSRMLSLPCMLHNNNDNVDVQHKFSSFWHFKMRRLSKPSLRRRFGSGASFLLACFVVVVVLLFPLLDYVYQYYHQVTWIHMTFIPHSFP